MSKHTIQEIFQTYGPEYIKQHKLSKEQWKVYNAITKCKTEQLGVHTMTCQDCGEVFTSLNSCRNRHCPMCQSYQKEKWIHRETENLLNCSYFHIVTTIPHELNELCLYNQKLLYNILFQATSQSIMDLTKDPKWLGAKVGITSILHTWGSSMEYHPHIHSIVTGGGLNKNQWVESKHHYLFKVQVLTNLFKGKFLSLLKKSHSKLIFPEHLIYLKEFQQWNNFLRPLYNKDWVTYIEPPKGSTENVIEYLGRYSFRVAISNERIKDISNGTITFEYKDYKDNGKIKIMKLSAMEFLRRFFLHVLPKSFTKIKHYGLFANSVKKKLLHQCKMLIQRARRWKKKTERVLPEWKCPSCGSFHLSFCFFLPNRS